MKNYISRKRQRLRLRFNRSVLVTMLVSFLSILVIPLLLNGAFYIKFQKDYGEKSDELNRRNLKMVSQSIDEQLLIADKIATSLAQNPEVTKYMVSPDDDLSVVKSITQTISALSTTTSYSIENVYIYFSKKDTIINTSSRYGAKEYYDYYLNYSDIKYEYFEDVFMKNPNYKNFCITVADSKEVLVVKRPIPITTTYGSTAMVVVHVNLPSLRTIAQKVLRSDDTAYITDDSGSVRLSLTESGTVTETVDLTQPSFKDSSGEGWITISNSSAIRPLHYYYALPRSVFSSDAKMLSVLQILSITAALLIGILLAFYLARQNYKPLKRLLGSFEDEDQKYSHKQNEYEYLTQVFTNVSEKYTMVKKMLNEQKVLLKANFYHQLLLGLTPTETSLTAYEEFFDTSFIQPDFAVVSLYLNQKLTEQDINRLFVDLYEIAVSEDLNCYIVRDTMHSFAMILNGQFHNMPRFHGKLTSLQQKIKEELPRYFDGLRMGVGIPCHSLMEIKDSYTQSQIALQYKLQSAADNLAFYTETSCEETVAYYYPLEIEIKIMNNVKVGNTDAAIKLVDTIIQENFSKRNLSPDMSHMLYASISATLFKIMSDIDTESVAVFGTSANIVNKLLGCNSIEEARNLLINLLRALCEHINSRSNAAGEDDLIEKILSYIEDTYCEHDFSLTKVADYIGLSPEHLSRYFKSKLGMTFISYITKRRVDRVKELLLESPAISTEHLVEQVGYNSVSTLNRTFKNIEGITPTQFRNKYTDHS